MEKNIFHLKYNISKPIRRLSKNHKFSKCGWLYKFIYQDSFCQWKVRTKWNLKVQFSFVKLHFSFFCLKLSKRIVLVYFLKTDWCYIFLKALNVKQKIYLKTQIGNAWNLDFPGVNFGRYTLCDAIYSCFETFQKWEKKSD